MTLIELKNVSKSYHNGQEELKIIRDLNLTVEEGQSVVITGESGCGKSTLLNLIGGLDYPSAGEIYSCGSLVSSLSEAAMTQYRNQELGFIFQFHYLLKDFSALENIAMPALMAGMSRKEAEPLAMDLLKKVGLQDRAIHYPGQLSGGERQRVVLARALMNQPKLILADEPTGNLDEGNSRVVEDILFQLTSELGKTLIVVTHDSHLAQRGERHFHLTGGGVQDL
ncbi:MAG: ABC transporter ATP-binding protein [Spirochaetaceae bacterium]|nr:ABC transporter ATP-binding protein [Spirochaetaceae bacterium]